MFNNFDRERNLVILEGSLATPAQDFNQSVIIVAVAGDGGHYVKEEGHSYSGNVLNTQTCALEPQA